MSDQAANEFPVYQANAGVGSWPIADGITVYDGMFCGLEGGYLNHWADGADDLFLGILQRGDVRVLAGPSSDRGKMIGETSDAIPPEAQVDISGVTLRNITDLGGSPTQAKVGDPVYCATSNRDDMTLTIGAHKRAIGWLSRYRSATNCDITLHPASKFAARAEMGGIISLTDNSTGTGTDTIAAGTGISTLAFSIPLAGISGNVDVVTNYVPGYKFKLLGAFFLLTKVVSTGSKAATLDVEIVAAGVTGGQMALTSANQNTLGSLTGAAITGSNTGSATEAISIVATSVTAFVEGDGCILLEIQNMDTADAVASLSDKINEILATE